MFKVCKLNQLIEQVEKLDSAAKDNFEVLKLRTFKNVKVVKTMKSIQMELNELNRIVKLFRRNSKMTLDWVGRWKKLHESFIELNDEIEKVSDYWNDLDEVKTMLFQWFDLLKISKFNDDYYDFNEMIKMNLNNYISEVEFYMNDEVDEENKQLNLIIMLFILKNFAKMNLRNLIELLNFMIPLIENNGIIPEMITMKDVEIFNFQYYNSLSKNYLRILDLCRTCENVDLFGFVNEAANVYIQPLVNDLRFENVFNYKITMFELLKHFNQPIPVNAEIIMFEKIVSNKLELFYWLTECKDLDEFISTFAEISNQTNQILMLNGDKSELIKLVLKYYKTSIKSIEKIQVDAMNIAAKRDEMIELIDNYEDSDEIGKLEFYYNYSTDVKNSANNAMSIIVAISKLMLMFDVHDDADDVEIEEIEGF